MTTRANSNILTAARNLVYARKGGPDLAEQAANRLLGEIVVWRWSPRNNKHVARYLKPNGRAVSSAASAIEAWAAEVA